MPTFINQIVNRKSMKLTLALIILILPATVSAASICYTITLNDGTSWKICKESTDMNFTMNGHVQGNGFLMENKYVNLADVGLKSTTKSMPESSDVTNFNADSQIYSEQNLKVVSQIINSTFNYKASGNNQHEVVDANVVIFFPVKLNYDSKFVYDGKEARSKEFIFNNNNGVTSKVEGSSINKQSNANVDTRFVYALSHLETGGIVDEVVYANGSLDYFLNSFANELTKFCTKYYDSKVDESYYGSFNVKKGVKMVTVIELPKEEAIEDWLTCPSG